MQNRRRKFLQQCINTSLALSLLLKNAFSANPNLHKKRKIPKYEEKIPIIGLGTYRTFDVGLQSQSMKMLETVVKKFINSGGRVIDTSPMYGNSETVIGSLTEKLQAENSLFHATKVWTNGKDQGINQIAASFKLMRVKTVDLLQIHNLVDWQTHITTLQTLKEEKKIRYMGITHYHRGAYNELERILKLKLFDFVQFNLSPIETEAEARLLPIAQETGHAVIVNRPFVGGQIFRKTAGIPLPSWAKDFDCNSWAQFCLKYILSHGGVTCVIPGTGKLNHLIDNIGASHGRLPDKSTRKKMKEFIATL
ncbi:MAG: aldo/keto reductase [Proteobacteria bacterium]|nr:aldo/keto reductase [Pseudomonadota bacterium]